MKTNDAFFCPALLAIRFRSCWVLSFLISTLIVLCSGGAELSVFPEVESSIGGVRLAVNQIDAPMILERSWDMENWHDIMLFTRSHPGESVLDPQSLIQRSAFYRLRAIEDYVPLIKRMDVNLSAVDPYLGSLKLGQDFELQLFGTRDSEGNTAQVTKMVYRVGETVFYTDVPPAASNAEMIKESLVYHPPIVSKGLVRVTAPLECAPPTRGVMIQYTGTVRRDGATGPLVPINGSIPAELIASPASETIYRYQLQTDAQVDITWRPRLDRAKEALWDGLTEAILPLDPEDLVLQAAGPMLESAGKAVVKLISRVNLAVAIYDFHQGASASWEATALQGTSEGAWSLETISLRAYIPGGTEGYFIAASPWRHYGYNEIPRAPFGDIPTLEIQVECGGALFVRQDTGSHVRATCSLVRNGSVYAEKTDLKQGADAYKCGTSLQVSDPEFSASTSSSFDFKNVRGQFILRAQTHLNKTGLVFPTVSADGRIVFSVTPSPTLPATSKVVTRLILKVPERVGVGCFASIGVVGQSGHSWAMNASGSVDVEMWVGVDYYLAFQADQPNTVSSTINTSTFTAVLLGHPLWIAP